MKALLAVATLVLCLSSVQAADTDRTLIERHQGTWPESVDGFVTKNQCLSCHGSYEALADKTEKLTPNPHRSHLGAVNCEECHKADSKQTELMCNQCHNFSYKQP